MSEILNIMVVIDEYCWAWDFHARGIKKYSRHNITIRRQDKVANPKNHDLVHFFGLYSYGPQRENPKHFIPNRKLICGIRSHARLDIPEQFEVVVCVSKKLYDIITELYPYKKFYLIHNAVDTDIFKPVKRSPDRFVVGWAGNSFRIVKRSYLLKEVEFLLRMKSDFSRKLFVKDCSRQPMTDFYDGINAYISVSKEEGMPTTVLEAASSGLPIVATDVGGVSEFLDDEWLIPASPDDVVIKELNKKLSVLKDDPKLREKIGNQNRKKTMQCWSWSKRTKEYDVMYEEVR